MDERLGKWHFWSMFIGFNCTFFPQHFLGIMGMPRRVATYQPQFQFWNEVSSISSYLMAASFVILLYNMIVSFRHGKVAGSNPWGARTLEWMIPSPPHYYNFKNIPAVYSAPYEFDKPLPYGNLQDELDERKMPGSRARSMHGSPA